MRKVKVRTLAQDSKTLYTAKRVSLTEGVDLPTPLVAGNVSIATGDQAFPPTVRGINELYRGFSADLLGKVKKESDADFLRSLNRPTRLAKARGDTNLVIPAVYQVPTRPLHIQYIADTAYEFADVLTTPVLNEARQVFDATPKVFDQFAAFTAAFLEDVARLNHKSILGVLPPGAYGRNEGLVELYLDAGINAFCVDLGGRSPSAEHHRNLRPLLKRLADQGMEEQAFLYALNAQSGRPGRQPKEDLTPAQDVLAFGYGFDALGRKHLKRAMGKAAEKDQKKQAPRFRFFDRHLYAYRSVALNQASKSLPTDASVALSGIKDEKTRGTLQSMVSIEQLALEAGQLHRVVADGSLAEHLAGKNELDADAKSSLRAARSQQSLSDW